MTIRFALVSVLALSTQAFAAPCPSHSFTEFDRIKLGTDAAMIVTHPSTMWDGRFSSKLGMDAAVRYAKARQMPIVYLQDSNTGSNNDSYFFSDCNPTYWFRSSGGEFNFEVTARHIYSVGGHWELCQSTSMNDLMDAWAKLPLGDLVLTQVMDGLYSTPSFVNESDPYFKDVQNFIKIVTYGRPESWPFPKLSVLETMGIIQKKELQLEYLKRNLPPYKKLSKKYEVELYYNGELIETLRKGQGENPPRLKLEFVNSLYEGGDIPGKEAL